MRASGAYNEEIRTTDMEEMTPFSEGEASALKGDNAA